MRVAGCVVTPYTSFALVLLLTMVGNAPAQDQAQKTQPSSDAWYKVVGGESGKSRIGWLHESREWVEEAGARVHKTSVEERDTTRQMDAAPSAATKYMEFVETADGHPVRFLLQQFLGKKGEGLLYEARGEVRDGTMQVTMSWGGDRTERASFRVPDDLLFPSAANNRIRKLDRAAGTKLKYEEITYDGGHLATRTLEVVGQDDVEFDGKRVGVLRVRETLDPTPDSRVVLYDAEGGRMRIEYNGSAAVRCSREEALAVPGHGEK